MLARGDDQGASNEDATTLLHMMLKAWSDGLREKVQEGQEGVHFPAKDAWDVSSIGASEAFSEYADGLGSLSVGGHALGGAKAADAQSAYTARLPGGKAPVEFNMSELMRRLAKV